MEDIADRADLALATFYAHYPNKDAVLFSVSNRFVEDLVQRIAYQGGPWNVVRRDAIQTAYKHAAGKPGLYRACMSDARTSQAYLSILSRYAEQNLALARVPARAAPGSLTGPGSAPRTTGSPGSRLQGAHRDHFGCRGHPAQRIDDQGAWPRP